MGALSPSKLNTYHHLNDKSDNDHNHHLFWPAQHIHWVKVFNMDANHPFSIICKFILNAFHGLSRYFEYSKGLEESKTAPHLKQPKLSLTNVPTGTDIGGPHELYENQNTCC